MSAREARPADGHAGWGGALPGGGAASCASFTLSISLPNGKPSSLDWTKPPVCKGVYLEISSPNIPERWQSAQRRAALGHGLCPSAPVKGAGPACSCGPSKGISPNGERLVESNPQFFKGSLVL